MQGLQCFRKQCLQGFNRARFTVCGWPGLTAHDRAEFISGVWQDLIFFLFSFSCYLIYISAFLLKSQGPYFVPTVFYRSHACGPLYLIEFIQRIALRALLFFASWGDARGEGNCIIFSTGILQLLFLQDKLLFFFHRLVIWSNIRKYMFKRSSTWSALYYFVSKKDVMYLSYMFEIKLGNE